MKNQELRKKQQAEIDEQRKIAEEIRKKQELEEQLRLEEELKANRRRKMSELPEEPVDSADVLKIAFRLPNGNRVFRNFMTTDQISVRSFIERLSKSDILVGS